VLVPGVNVFKLDARREHKLPRVFNGQSARTNQPSANARFFQDFAQRGVVRQLVVLDVAAGWQPAPQLAVVVEQDAASVDDKDGDGEVAQDRARSERRMGGHARGAVYPVGAWRLKRFPGDCWRLTTRAWQHSTRRCALPAR